MMQGFGASDWTRYRMGEVPPHKMQDSLGNALLVPHGSKFVGFHINYFFSYSHFVGFHSFVRYRWHSAVPH